MSAARQPNTEEPRVIARRQASRRHLGLVSHDRFGRDECRHELDEARWLALLIAVVTVATVGLSSATMFGAASGAWWPVVLAAVFVAVVVLAVVVLRETR